MLWFHLNACQRLTHLYLLVAFAASLPHWSSTFVTEDI